MSFYRAWRCVKEIKSRWNLGFRIPIERQYEDTGVSHSDRRSVIKVAKLTSSIRRDEQPSLLKSVENHMWVSMIPFNFWKARWSWLSVCHSSEFINQSRLVSHQFTYNSNLVKRIEYSSCPGVHISGSFKYRHVLIHLPSLLSDWALNCRWCTGLQEERFGCHGQASSRHMVFQGKHSRDRCDSK